MWLSVNKDSSDATNLERQRAIKLFEDLSNSGVVLYFAASGKKIDVTSADGRMSAFMQAFLDDMYVMDASRRAKDSVNYRKRRGVSIGIPPFGTVRDKNGYLIPSPHGAWLMPDGTFEPGTENDPAPHPDAVWRGYHDCARYILEVYANTLHGYKKTASRLNAEGWAFRDRYNQPARVKMDDVLRVVSNWREYAGIITEGRARQRTAYRIENPTDILRDTGRAVFDLDLLRKVAEKQAKNSRLTRVPGTTPKAHVYPLSHILQCACCAQKAESEQDETLRARLIGWDKGGELRYRHSESRTCTSKRKSIRTNIIEQDFLRLIEVLTVHPDALDLMAELATQAQYDDAHDPKEQEEKRQAAIAMHRRAISNCLNLCKSGAMEFADYERERDYHERQIVHLEAQLTDRQQITLEFTSCAELLKRIQQFWNYVDDEERKLLAHSLFDEITYDLEKQRITDFRVKAWAEPFLVMRAALYEDELGEEMKNRFNSGLSSDVSSLSPNGCWNRTFTLLDFRLKTTVSATLLGHPRTQFTCYRKTHS